jgi:hypothetical protein
MKNPINWLRNRFRRNKPNVTLVEQELQENPYYREREENGRIYIEYVGPGKPKPVEEDEPHQG